MIVRNRVRKIIRKLITSSILSFHFTTLCTMEIQRQFMDRVILYMGDKESKRVSPTTPDREVSIFMLATPPGEKGVEYLGVDSTKLCRRERVRVIDRKFEGTGGYVCRIKEDSRLVVAIQEVRVIVTSYIPQSFIQRI